MASPEKKKPKKRTGFMKTLLKLMIFLILPVAVGIGVGVYFAISRTIPSIEELKQGYEYQGTRIYASDDVLIGELKVKKGTFVPIKQISKNLINAVVAIEDAHFWQHSGIDYLAIVRAAAKDVMKRHMKEGGSTITQQLAKITFLSSEKTFQRKLRELVLARRIEANLSKDEILEFYLNRVYFGNGAYGAEMASKVYFGKHAIDINVPEAAMLAGLLKAPTAFSPVKDFERSKNRQRTVLERMEEEGFLDQKGLKEAIEFPLVFAKRDVESESNNYFIDYVKKLLEREFDEDAIYKGGMTVFTTLDTKMQAEAQRALRSGLREVDKRRGWRGPIAHRDIMKETAGGTKQKDRRLPPGAKDIMTALVLKVEPKMALLRADEITAVLRAEDAQWASAVFDKAKQKTTHLSRFDLTHTLRPGDVVSVRVKGVRGPNVEVMLEQEPEVQGALIAFDYRTGHIRALVGGYDYAESQFNRAVVAERQVGSTFKPVVYAAAMNKGFTTSSIIVDEKIIYENARDDVWTPQNYDREYHGATRLRDGLAYSRNVVTIKLAQEVGVDAILNLAKGMGIEGTLPPDLSIALGSLTTTPLSLTVAYSAFANGGNRTTPIAIRYIKDRNGKVVRSYKSETTPAMDPKVAFLVTSMMKDVINYGTGGRAKALGRPAAGKTGTTNEYKDAWFLAFTSDLMTGVWVGMDDSKSLGPGEAGSRCATPIWTDFMKAIGSGGDDFHMPEGIVTRKINGDDGLLATEWTEKPITEYYIEGTEPKEYSKSIWKVKEETNPLF